jgi:hypothetical protein
MKDFIPFIINPEKLIILKITGSPGQTKLNQTK